jgi:hypothetical protein
MYLKKRKQNEKLIKNLLKQKTPKYMEKVNAKQSETRQLLPDWLKVSHSDYEDIID